MPHPHPRSDNKTPHIPEELSTWIDWSPFAIMGNTMPPRDQLRLDRITSAQAEFLFALPEKVAKIIRNTPPEPIKTAIRMLPGTTHRKRHVYQPRVPVGRQKAYGNQWPVDFIGFLVSLAEREGFEPPIGLHLCRISSAVHSTTLPPLQVP